MMTKHIIKNDIHEYKQLQKHYNTTECISTDPRYTYKKNTNRHIHKAYKQKFKIIIQKKRRTMTTNGERGRDKVPVYDVFSNKCENYQ